MKKKHELIMLPTDNVKEANALIGKYFDVHHLILRIPDDIPKGYGHELYILSNDEIKEGDWVIDTVGRVKQATKLDENYNGYRKIIATTNSDLKINTDYKGRLETKQDKIVYTESLPQIPLDFIKHYISEYNKGMILKEVEVEYLEEEHNNSLGKWNTIKINQDNTINISIVENKLYTRNEVEQLIRTFDMQLGRDVETVKFDNWIKENLK